MVSGGGWARMDADAVRPVNCKSCRFWGQSGVEDPPGATVVVDLSSGTRTPGPLQRECGNPTGGFHQPAAHKHVEISGGYRIAIMKSAEDGCVNYAPRLEVVR